MNDVREPRGETLCKKLIDQFEIIRNLIVEFGTNYKSWVWPALPQTPGNSVEQLEHLSSHDETTGLCMNN